jgi:isopentenyl-diphosphate Delta-isomerase
MQIDFSGVKQSDIQNMEDKRIILVDELDNVLGYEEKLKAHEDGALHRAFSIFVVNSKGEIMLQRRALDKYHSGGLWTNTCCSHPLEGEIMETTIHKRMEIEMGFDCPMAPLFTFIYKAEFGNGLIEHELDHVYLGKYEGEPNPSPAEACDWKWMDIYEVKKDMQRNPHMYTYWFKHCYGFFCQLYADRMLQRARA